MRFSITKAGQSAKTAPKPPRKQILSAFRYTTGPIPWYYKKQNDGAGRLWEGAGVAVFTEEETGALEAFLRGDGT